MATSMLTGTAAAKPTTTLPTPDRRRRSLLPWLLSPWAARPVAGLAAATAAEPLPAEVARPLPAARLWGSSSFRFFGLRIYDVNLWTGSGFVAEQYPQHAFALELRYRREFTGADIAKRSLSEMRRIEAFDAAQGQRWLAAMVEAFPDVRDGDRLTGLNQPGDSAQFFHNGQPTRTIADAAFARRFFGIWLAPQTSEPALRRQLLAGRP